MSKKLKIIITCISAAISALLVFAAWTMSRPQPTSVQSVDTVQRTITRAELTAADGEDGRSCYVGLEGEVYEIKNSIYWKQGQHVPSEGQAYCGRDLTDVINKSPHGKTILSRMTKIGTLAQ
jgi:predicted heme/steroid binding protein